MLFDLFNIFQYSLIVYSVSRIYEIHLGFVWEKGKGKGEKDLLVYFYNEVYAKAFAKLHAAQAFVL
jgi:hypothetical protein